MQGEKFDIFEIKYVRPKFGTENEFETNEHLFLVQTTGGKKDAKAALEKYHPGCKIMVIMSRMESIAGLEMKLRELQEKENAKKR